MDKLKINTPQNVQIEYKIASVGSRMLAIIIDLFILVAYSTITGYILMKFDIDDPWAFFSIYMLMNLPVIFYFFYMETFLNGQTVGKRIMNIKVIRIDGNKASAYEYFVRWIFTVIDILMMSGVIGLFSMILSKKTQRIGDIAANTTVIDLKPKLNLNQTILEQIEEERVITFPEVEKLSDRDVNLIKQNLQLSIQKNDISILKSLTEHLEKILNVDSKKMGYEKFIKTILEDHYQLNKNR